MMGAGVLVWLPEISQTDLHHIARAIYVARASKSDLAVRAAHALDALMSRRAEAKKRLGSDDPLLLATVFHENLTEQEYQQSTTKLEGIRLLPLDKRLVRTHKGDINQFPQIVTYWASPQGPYGKLPIEKWADLLKLATTTIGNA